MSRIGCCYTIDERYLLPAVVSATQLRININSNDTDVLIICFGNETALTRLFKRICLEKNIIFILVPHSVRDGLSMYFARFFIDKIVGNGYDKILYLDGDTQITGSLQALFDFMIKPGCIVAVPDPMNLTIGFRSSRNSQRSKYLSSIGLGLSNGNIYYNSGVMLANNSDWAIISRECLHLIRAKGEIFQFPDQDPLNIVTMGNVLQGSFKWNFPAFFLNFGLDNIIYPEIYHFMSNPRPWQGNFAPWMKSWSAPYKKVIAEYPDIKSDLLKTSAFKAFKYLIRQSYVEIIEGASWRKPSTINALIKLESTASI